MLSNWHLRRKCSLKDAPRSKDTFQKIMWLLSWLLGTSLSVLVNILHYKCWNFRHGCFLYLVLRKGNKQKEQLLKPGTWPGSHNKILLFSSWTWAMPRNTSLRQVPLRPWQSKTKPSGFVMLSVHKQSNFHASHCIPVRACAFFCPGYFNMKVL